MNLGRCDICFNVKDLKNSMAFYKKLDFEVCGGNVEGGWAVLKHGNLNLCLFQGHITSNMLNFRGGDVFAIARELKARGLALKSDAAKESDGSDGAILEDPDGNVLYFNTSPGEKA